ncbi:MAG: DUF1707 domain-containing protein [Streptosporangiaceae bacterium]|jgi:hypothetical protein
MTGPGDEMAAGSAAGSRPLALQADRERVIDVLKAAFVQGRLDIDELDLRVGRALASRTFAELATVSADLPAGPAGAQPPRWLMSKAARWGASGFITPAILAVAFAVAPLGGDEYGAAAFLIAFVYFLFWLSSGANMLWEWHCASLPSTRMCVRCAHAAASHRAPASCAARPGSLNFRRRCPCAGYVPPGISPQTLDLMLVPTR